MTDILKQGRELAEAQYATGGFKGKKNAYECDGENHLGTSGCGSFIVTIDRDPGVTPFMLKCGNCGGFAHSKFYRVQDWLEPTHEWYRPDTLDGIPVAYYDHLSNGGIILRPINGGPDKWQRPPGKPDPDEIIASLRRAQAAADVQGEEMLSQIMSRQVRRRLDRKGRA